jgi:hypothetical protein
VKTAGIGGTAGFLLALSWTQVGVAQTCADLVFTGPVAREFPDARNACIGVETREGRQYAHFQARIRSVRGNTVEAEFKMPDGTYSRPISVTPNPDSRVRIQGRDYRWRDLSRGQELDVYLPPDRWELVVPEGPQLAAAPTVTTLAIAEPAPVVAATTLPRTASLLPLIGALGGMLTALGFAIAVIRRRFL